MTGFSKFKDLMKAYQTGLMTERLFQVLILVLLLKRLESGVFSTLKRRINDTMTPLRKLQDIC